MKYNLFIGDQSTNTDNSLMYDVFRRCMNMRMFPNGWCLNI